VVAQAAIQPDRLAFIIVAMLFALAIIPSR
jgi:hypothetical protein